MTKFSAGHRVVATFLLLIIIPHCHSITLKDLYPFGSQDEVLNKESNDVSSSEIALTVPIVHFQDTFGSIYINDNGLLSFMTEVR